MVLGTDLTGKMAVVTGAGGILCGMFARTLARAGAAVALLDINLEAAEETARDIREAGGTAAAYGVDVMDKEMLEGGKPVIKYYDGVSMNAIWAVPSLGIDPVTGREIYRKKDGRSTFTYDVNDMVICGDNLPKLNGSFSIIWGIKGWDLI